MDRCRITTVVSFGLTLGLFSACRAPQKIGGGHDAAEPEQGRHVWMDDSGEGRAQVVLFRRDIVVQGDLQKATLNLFADSRYLLSVNGNTIGAGPARAYPEHPEYDSIDLRPFLHAGKNVIGVKVLNFGTLSYQLRRNPGTFIAWGQVQDEGAAQDLRTPGNWKAIRDEGYDETAPRMSFATSPIEEYDARKGVPDWQSPDASLAGWQTPVALKNPSMRGPLTPRSIPDLTQDLVTPKHLLSANALKDDEELFAFRVKVPDRTGSEFSHGHLVFAKTAIHSPKAQTVTVGLWWGDHYLNGAGPLVHEGLAPGQRARRVVRINLRAGWNPFFVQYKAIWGIWDFRMAVPRDARLTFSTESNFDGGPVFETAGPFDSGREAELALLPKPFAPETTSLRWTPVPRNEGARNPAVNIAWSQQGSPLAIDRDRLFDIDIPAGPDAALIFDLGGKQLGRVFIEYEAGANTAIDIGFSEDLEEGRPTILRRSGLYSGTRHISAGGVSRFETITPYGARYLQVNVIGHGNGARIRRIGMIRQVYPFEKKGSFVSSDPMLNAIWEMGWRTLQVCSEDSYIDTPFRERGLYAGDALPEVAITLATSGDLRLAVRSLRLFQQMYESVFKAGVQPHPDEVGLLGDFPFITLDIWKWVIDRTGDLALAREMYDEYRFLVDSALERRDPDGLVTMPHVFIEWSQIEKNKVKSTAFHALLARDARSLSDIASRLGDSPAAQFYSNAAQQVEQAIRTHLWDPQKGAFRDGIKDGKPIDSTLPISSAWAALWGIPDEAQLAALGAFWERELRDIGIGTRTARATPYGGFYVIGALYRGGHARIAEDFMRKYWGQMIAYLEDTAWEDFDPGLNGTLSHAWSGSPTYHLSTQVLGVDLGYPVQGSPDDIVIAPQAETIEWARGTVPHPRGVISVNWRVDGDVLRMHVEVPEGVEYQVKPRGRLAGLRLQMQ
jgi:alpha-L-rhamnosidase